MVHVPPKRSHINVAVYDSRWEAAEHWVFDRHPAVDAWVKNDHLGFEILYVHRGVVRKYRPDFLVRLTNGVTLILEVKGDETDEAKAKDAFLKEWVAGVNQHGGFGVWTSDVSRHQSDVEEILTRAGSR